MKWKTNITEIRGGEEYIRGTRLSDMIQKSDFVDAIFLLWTGRAPSNEERTMLHALFVSCIDHGVGAPSATVARTVASTGNSVHTALAAGIAALGTLHGGSIEGAAEFFHEHVNTAEVGALVAEKKKQGCRIPGFGHKVLTKDGRATALFGVAKKTGFYGRHSVFAQQIEHELNAGSSKQVPLNIDGVMAAVILDMGFEPAVARAFYCRTGPWSHRAYPGGKRGAAGLRRIDETDIVYE